MPTEQGMDGGSAIRFAPAALRNRAVIADVLATWLPSTGTVLEVASGTGEHVSYFAERFANLDWQPSDPDPDALASIAARQTQLALPNLRPPLEIDAALADWPIDRANALLCINMLHISPWISALGLLEGAARLLPHGAPLILYGPWLIEGIETAPSNLAFDADLKRRDSRWGLRLLSKFRTEAERRGLAFLETRNMPANNVMLLFRRVDPAAA